MEEGWRETEGGCVGEGRRDDRWMILIPPF